ncbi:seryl-tRNA synthetase [Thiohalorhabdus denitrificans]|uniref:Serine--tRNA ligase n=1 Tax=Thiohalorhabdus denitrificans TaxID=381306 RepID=A0A0P9CTT2_9GAMM|nr:serine--tRNA ligase [Thiohalorhabdus denitrificans]KPV40066.1 seryl-tRNA synthetase [Thiohalorhabdus denitrificans]SCY14370.1 seryl-tRNA synthetase [Thiohalorhabdus denitrificans]
MLDPHLLREDPEGVAEALAKRGYTLDVAAWRELESRRKEQQTRVEELQAERKQVSKAVGEAKKAGDEATAAERKERGEAIGRELEELDNAFQATKAELEAWLLEMPNLPDPQVPVGADENENAELRRVGEPPAFDFPVQDHVDVGAGLGILDAEAGANLAGSRFTVLRGAGARLSRALGQFMMDLQTELHGYTEIAPPLLARDDTLQGTGQLPKFGDDLFQTREDGFYLIPTAEVPLTNLHRESIVEEADLPGRYVAWTPCFRREAGSYGKDTRGMIRQHQFDKVELVQVVHPDQGPAAWEAMCGHAEEVLRRLELPYRVVELCTGDLGFAARRTYDLEVWLPAQETYREISSVSWCHDFQARRMGARFRPDGEKKPRLVHTLNGSGVAIGRALVALLENGQQADGSVRVPEALRPYLGGQALIGG